MHPVLPFTVAGLLFGLGVAGVLRRRNAVLLLMSVELLLNAVNLVFVTADATVRGALPLTGQVFTLFVIVLAAAEVGVGLALILQLYRLRAAVAVDELPLTEPPDGSELGGPPRGPGFEADEPAPVAPGVAG